MGALHLAHVVLAELHTDLLHLSTSGKPFDPVFILSRSVSNIICSVVFGSRFDYDDERLLTIIHFINDNFKIMSSPWGEVSTRRSTRWGHGSTGSKNVPGASDEIHAYKPHTKEAEGRGLPQVPDQARQNRKNSSLKTHPQLHGPPILLCPAPLPPTLVPPLQNLAAHDKTRSELI